MQKISVGNVSADVVKKDIKNIHLAVYPPFGRVRVAAPKKTTNEVIRLLMVSKMSWINKQKKKFLSQERETKREFVDGESHYFFGKRYLLKVIPGSEKNKVEVKNKKYINLYLKPGAKKEKIVKEWYREELKNESLNILEKLQNKTGLEISDFRVRSMKTRWGTCNIKDKRIWLNLELAKKDKKHIEYVLLHELIHLLERKHNNAFKGYMDKFMPNWRECKEGLNKGVLSC